RRLSALAKADRLHCEQTTRSPAGHAQQERRQSPTQQSGSRAEALAISHLRAEGLTILQRNLQCRAGEIDLVCRYGNILVFVEVRRRNTSRFGGAAASVNRPKQVRLIRAARYFLPRLARLYFHDRI